VFCAPHPGVVGDALNSVQPHTSRQLDTWFAYEKVFMNEFRQDGSAVSVVAIKAWFSDQGAEPRGLGFLYRSGEERTLGTTGTREQVMKLAAVERLTRMETCLLNNRKVGFINVGRPYHSWRFT
jgi:hypothetical protein